MQLCFRLVLYRLLKKLKEKNEQEIELEKKEQGFSIYVNGANVELGQAYSRAKSRSSSRHAKTAGGEIIIFHKILRDVGALIILTWSAAIKLRHILKPFSSRRVFFTCLPYVLILLIMQSCTVQDVWCNTEESPWNYFSLHFLVCIADVFCFQLISYSDAHRERKKILQHELETLEREAEARWWS